MRVPSTPESHAAALMAERAWDELQRRYGDQTAHLSLGGPDAKRRRAEKHAFALAAAAAAAEEGEVGQDAGDMVRRTTATDVVRSEPHPESGVPREEDEFGSGEDEHAEYTGATERIPLGREAERRHKAARRRQMRQMIAAVEGPSPSGDNDEDDIAIVVRRPRAAHASAAPRATAFVEEDAFAMHEEALPPAPADEQDREDEDAWEQAQLRRMGIQPEAREPSPFRPVPVPRVAPLPTPTSCLARLRAQMAALDTSAAQHAALTKDNEATLRAIDGEEAELRASVEALEKTSAWFNELSAFVESLAAFLDEKTPLLETLEHNVLALLADRAVSRQRARALQLEDDLALVHGVSGASLWVPRNGVDETLRRSDADGPWNSAARLARAAQRPLQQPSDTPAQWLSPAEVAQFAARAAEVRTQAAQLLADVAAPEFRDPAAPEASQVALVARFDEWRTRFPHEYDLAWGGLALANAWEWWARREMATWDPFWAGPGADSACVLDGATGGLEALAWEHALAGYVERGAGRGGDNEAVATVVERVVVARLVALAEATYDPWSAAETSAALALVEQVSYVLPADKWSFQALVRAFFTPLQRHGDALVGALTATPTMRGAAIHPDVPPARLRIVQAGGALATQLLRWSVHWLGPRSPPWSAGERGAYEALVDRVLAALWNELVQAQHLGGVDVARALLAAAPPGEMRGRLAALVHNAQDTL